MTSWPVITLCCVSVTIATIICISARSPARSILTRFEVRPRYPRHSVKCLPKKQMPPQHLKCHATLYTTGTTAPQHNRNKWPVGHMKPVPISLCCTSYKSKNYSNFVFGIWRGCGNCCSHDNSTLIWMTSERVSEWVSERRAHSNCHLRPGLCCIYRSAHQPWKGPNTTLTHLTVLIMKCCCRMAIRWLRFLFFFVLFLVELNRQKLKHRKKNVKK